jgi:hypothetical protein
LVGRIEPFKFQKAMRKIQVFVALRQAFMMRRDNDGACNTRQDRLGPDDRDK